ncbi:hypothetical protein [[Mycobacterium] zoologicum]|uniref:hypothetical protein n=1 Tax=[Mycobacterium] zoologicum TaxID=2872311 RepID=UPI001CDB4651|nr:hypothetical protein [Mycolicibacter sp. MYC101]MEB3062753.1 hypothetical protein [Mycolicibacter sp. MYC101]
MNLIVHRPVLILLTLVGLSLGVWAYLAPQNWYNTFPGMGMHWLPVLGPYNEHFVKDVGCMFLALGVLSAFAVYHLRNRAVVVIAGITWSVFNLLHLTYHIGMLHMYGPRDAILNAVSLSLLLAVSLTLLVPARDH